MLCRCARVVLRRGTATSATSSIGSSGPRRLRLRPPVPSVPVMTSSSPVDERRVFLPSEAATKGIPPRARMSAVAEQTEDEEHAEDGSAVAVMPVRLRPLSEQGSAGARRCREDRYTPGVVYAAGEGETGRGERLMVKVNTKFINTEIRRLESSFENTVYKLAFEGEGEAEVDQGAVASAEDGGESSPLSSNAVDAGLGQGVNDAYRGLVFPNEVRLHPVRRTLLSMNFIRYKVGRRHPVPIRYVNEDLNVNIRKGAIILRLRTHQYITLPQDPADVPQWLDLDLEHVQSGNKLRVRDIMMPQGVALFRGNEQQTWDEVICTIKGKKLAKVDTEDGDFDEEDEDED